METTTPSLRRNALLYVLIGLSLTVVSVILRCFNLFFFFDTEIGYYQKGAILPIVSAILLIAAVAFFAICAVLWFRKAAIGYDTPPSVTVRIGASLAAIGFAALIVTEIIDVALGGTLSIVNLLFGLLSVAYFVMLALNLGRDGLRILCGFCVILRLLLALGGSYFNVMVQMNAPDKLFFHLGCLGGMLFLVSEMRSLIASTRPALYFFSAGSASLFLGVASLPSILAYHSGRLTDDSVLGGYYMLLGLFLYTVIRLLSVAVNPMPATRSEEVATEAACEEENEESIEELAETEADSEQVQETMPESPDTEEISPEEEPTLEETRNEDPS
ncbi:MAG: hypothetical protein E7668_07155 [Ruminococcaceae bacterium]|nr:hypothetical protein [Oscillospiraceae bacterium]